jgi:hypothetical protein
MPVYAFKNKDTEEIEEHTLRISEYDKFKEDNPHLERYIDGSPGMSDPVRLGLVKPSEGFREVLRNIQKGSPRSKINTFS